jgi:membrane associated rhomboid family serine protease
VSLPPHDPQPDDNPTREPVELPHSRTEPWISRFPATFGLIAITMFVFLTQWFSMDILDNDLLLRYGVKSREAIAAGQVWRLITPIFIHVGLWHFFINMYSLYVLGPAVESFFGSARMLAFYLISGVGGVGMSMLFSPHDSTGASGAIFGLLGGLVAFFFRHRKVFGRRGMMQFRNLIFVALINLFLGLMPGIDNWGHVGGFITGAVVSYFLGPQLEPQWMVPERPRLVDYRPWRDTRQWILLSGVLIIALSMMASYSALGQ